MTEANEQGQLKAPFLEWLAIQKTILELEGLLTAAKVRNDELRLIVLEGMSLGKPNLTQREREVLLAIQGHLSDKEIADKLNISYRTVKFHVSNILSKMKAMNRREL